MVMRKVLHEKTVLWRLHKIVYNTCTVQLHLIWKNNKKMSE